MRNLHAGAEVVFQYEPISCLSNPTRRRGSSFKSVRTTLMKANDLKLPEGMEVYVDMDGVLADFFTEYAKLAGIESGNYRDIPPAKTDPTLNKMVGTDFFARLPKFPTADKLLDIVVQAADSYNICSSPLRGDHEGSAHYKKVWINKHLNIPPKNIFIVSNKAKYAKNANGMPNVLIDDRGSNISAWEAAGGIGIKYQADEDSLKKIIDGLKRARRVGKGDEEHEPQKLTSLDRGKMIAVHTSGDKDIEEARKKKRKKARHAAYGPGPYGGYGYASGYSGGGEAGTEDYDINDPPPGPETKPTMPAGTVRVDVSDVYDWYKLGQHISNMKGLGKHDFGKGPPSTIFSFGSEEEEHKYINALKKTGLTTTDIDPVDPRQPKGMKRQKVDPTYNVGETSNDSIDQNDLKEIIKKFLPVAMKELGIDNLPKIRLVSKVGDGEHPSFGMFNHNEERIYLGIKNRHPGDILRTLAHELVHYKQLINNELDQDSGETGSPDENEAHIMAGKIMRHFNDQNPKIFDHPPVEENFADGRNPQDKGDSKRHGISKGMSIAQLKKIRSSDSASPRKKQLAHWQINMRQGKKK
jgi:hypothetical protein